MKCMLHHHGKVGLRKITPCNNCDRKEGRWQTLAEMELSSENLSLSRKLKWLKVRDVLLQGSCSAPSSPVKSDCFAYDAEYDEVDSGDVLGEKYDDVFDDNGNLRYQIEASYTELKNKLTNEFARKMEEIAHNSYIKHRFRLKKTGDTCKSVAQEVIVPTSAGLFRFEGISDKFTRRLHEWEVSKGITPDESTFALLDPQYKLLSNKVKDNLVEYNVCKGKSKSTSSIVDMAVTNPTDIRKCRSSSLSLNDVEEMQASRVQVTDLRGDHQNNLANFKENKNSPPSRKSEEPQSTTVDSRSRIVLSDNREEDTKSGIKCRKMVDSSYQLLQENISLLDKLKKEREVCRQLEDDMINLEGQIHDVSRSFEQDVVDKFDLPANPENSNLNSFEFQGNRIDTTHLDSNTHSYQAYQAYPDVSVEYRMKLGQLHTENHNFQTETVNTIYDEIYPQHDLNNLTEKKSSGTLINGLISELLEMADRLEAAVVEEEKEIFHLKYEMFRKEMASLHGNKIRSYFSSFTLPIHWLRGRRSQELSRLPKHIMNKLLELKQAFILESSKSQLGTSVGANLGLHISSSHSLRRCVGHEDLSPEPMAILRSTVSSPASSFSLHDSLNADDLSNHWIPFFTNNHAASPCLNNSDWFITRDEHFTNTDVDSEDGEGVMGSLLNVSNVLVPTTRKIFSPIGDSKVIEYVIEEDFSEKNTETEQIAEDVRSKLEIFDSDEIRKQETLSGTGFDNNETEIIFSDNVNSKNTASYQKFVISEIKDISVEELTIGEELSASLKLRAMKIQKAKEEFLLGTASSIVIESLDTNLPNKLVVKSASADEITTAQPPKESSVTKEYETSQTKSNKLSFFGIFKRQKRKCKEGVVSLARQSLNLSSEPADYSQTKSCPSSPVLAKNDSRWIKNPAKIIFRPKGKYMINYK
ncbi:uncharacterized protein isoform X2 [Rhodnius prolixus]